MSTREYNGETPHECQGKNFHNITEILHADLGPRSTVTAWCDDCQQEIVAEIDFKHADCDFESRSES